MKKLIVIFFLLPLFVQAQLSTKSAGTDLEALAKNIVNQCADIQENEIVFINGDTRDIELLEDIAVNVRKNGAFPLLTVSSDRLTRKMFTEVPEKYDTQLSILNMEVVKMMTTQISVTSGDTPGLLADIPPERFVARNKAQKPVNDLYRESSIKSVQLGNGLYPTKNRAAQFEMPVDQLSKMFWDAINMDYNKLTTIGEKLSKNLTSGNTLKIVHDNGTNLSVKIADCTPYISDGKVSADKPGGAGRFVYLPAGEVFFAPVAGTANGTLVLDQFLFRGKTIKGLKLVFEDGKLTSMEAKSDIETLKDYYDAQDDLLAEFSFVDFGINPKITVPEGSKLYTYIPAGTITLGIGNNFFANGDNNSNASMDFHLAGSTVTVDNTAVIEKGKLIY
ncbi:aminopeptidase [uncultured Draconibacterium sp.]|uniref:aminopeptidase n=1 Tax=uncultured Draconibacterium sp. TaxID=1573823 RepID=UPI0029C6F51A|nr:aminopeptidase [uncultured Draconibacterium sp.]